jgi:phosphatidate phosphatase APP1
MSDESIERRRALQRGMAGLRRAAAAVETQVDRVRWGAKRRLGWVSPVEIMPYRGFGTHERITLRGRVLEAKGHEPPSPKDRRWKNFVRMVRRLDSDEIPGARVTVRFAGQSAETITDDEGYFRFELHPRELPSTPDGWHGAELDLASGGAPGQGPVTAQAELLVPDAGAEHGIISDIDDTVLQTHVTSVLKMASVTMLGNALTRLPFEGTTLLYQALVTGRSGQARNPVFYVSKSPWGLYDLLVDFMARHGLPRGPLLLRDLGLRSEATLDFKSACITEILATYPRLRFILVGDSGERDPEIYLEVLRRCPERVAAIYIREVDERPSRRVALERHVAAARALGVEMLLLSHARDALAHARRHGLASGGG